MAIKKTAASVRPLSKFEYDYSLWCCETDEEVALYISKILDQHGYNGFVEHRDQVAGALKVTEVTKVIQQSRITIIILSQSSLDSAWCRRVSEWNLQHYIENRSKVFPVYVNMVEDQIPLVLRHISGLHYESRYFIEKLLHSLNPRNKSVCKARLRK